VTRVRIAARTPDAIFSNAKIDPTAIGYSSNRWSTACNLVGCLTAREYEIFSMLGDGLDNRRISSMLAISQRTVKFHVTSILRKLKVESRLQAGLAAAEYSRLAAFEA
jgi:DNA-binding NarL/FixJ family response regulator